jgi:hypothetical protein
MRTVYEAPLAEVVDIRPGGMIAVSELNITPPFDGSEDW